MSNFKIIAFTYLLGMVITVIFRLFNIEKLLNHIEENIWEEYKTDDMYANVVGLSLFLIIAVFSESLLWPAYLFLFAKGEKE